MKLVLDANRLFSALLTDGSTRKAIYEARAALFAPAFLRTELAKHRGELRRRSRLTAKEFAGLLAEIQAQIVWVPDEAIAPHLEAARQALGHVDINDVAYLACALAIEAAGIWSHDRGFDQQSLVRRVAHPKELGD